ncbi:MAG: DUF2436 domain-containing protein [Oscillospiraceae bacterium]
MKPKRRNWAHRMVACVLAFVLAFGYLGAQVQAVDRRTAPETQEIGTEPVWDESVAAVFAEDPNNLTDCGNELQAETDETPTLDEALNAPGGDLHFVTEGDYPWVVDSEEGCAKSSNYHVGDSTSAVSVTFTAEEGQYLFFDYRVSSMWGDYLKVSLDGEYQNGDGWYGVHDWTSGAYVLTAGEHTVTWAYTKDTWNNGSLDTAFLRNVQVGFPVPVENVAFLDRDVTVAVDRTLPLTWQIAPEDAFRQEVTFSSSDETVATIDAQGVVTGVNAGECTVTITTVDGGHTDSCTVSVTPANPTAFFRGWVSFDPAGVSSVWGDFYDWYPGRITPVSEMKDTFGAEVLGDRVYGYLSLDEGGRFYVADYESMQMVYPGGNSGGVLVADMAYDYSRDVMYVLGSKYVGSTTVRTLYTVDLVTGEMTEVAEIQLDRSGSSIITLAISADGQAYGICSASEPWEDPAMLYRIDLETGETELVGSTGLYATYLQSMAFDHNTGKLYWAQYHTQSNGLYEVNTQTGAVTLVGQIGGGSEVTALLIPSQMQANLPQTDVTVTYVDGYTGQTISTQQIPLGHILSPEELPEAPVHDGVEFAAWDYNGAVVYGDLTVTALYADTSATTATVMLTAGDVWGDGGEENGYQMLLDADATVCENGWWDPDTMIFGPAAERMKIFEDFEYKLPEGIIGDPALDDSIFYETLSLEIPAGVYDWCILHASDPFVFSSSNYGNCENQADDFRFYPGMTYHFTVYRFGSSDAISLEVTGALGYEPEPEEPTPPALPDPEASATIIFEVDSENGYQMLFDRDANTYDSLMLTTFLSNMGDASPGVYENFERKIPWNADGCLITENVVRNATVKTRIEAGVYDWCVASPIPGSTVLLISSDSGNIEGSADDYPFEAGYTYHFRVHYDAYAREDVLDLVRMEPTAQYEVTYTAGANGSLLGQTGVTVYEDTVLDAARIPTPVPEPGYRFVGWAEADPTGYCVTGPVTFTAIFAPVAEASAFRDIKNHWAYEEICAVVESGLMFGVTQTAFVPNGAVTRAQAVTVLYRMFGEGQQPEGELPFADVPEDAWYYREMLWAYEAGIFQGVSEDRANPNGQLTREQFAALMYRALGAPDSDGTVGYGDAAQIHAWARDAVAYMSSCGMLQGYPDGSFRPQRMITRGELCCLLLGVMQHQDS